MGYPPSGLNGVLSLSHIRTGWGTLHWDWMGVCPGRTGWVAPQQDWMGVPQQSEYLLHGGHYASWIHAGGLSVCIFLLQFPISIREVESQHWQSTDN